MFYSSFLSTIDLDDHRDGIEEMDLDDESISSSDELPKYNVIAEEWLSSLE